MHKLKSPLQPIIILSFQQNISFQQLTINFSFSAQEESFQHRLSIHVYHNPPTTC